MNAVEINFDGLVGPTHNYSALSFGNRASMASHGKKSFPKQAAIQGLQKMKLVKEIVGIQGILPPLPRPNLNILNQLGFGLAGADEVILEAKRTGPAILSACFSASAMWVANAATITPSADAKDKKVNFTTANLVSKFHRSMECQQTFELLKSVFADPNFFTHHTPLPKTQLFGDEGAANHIRFCSDYGGKGVHLFVYGQGDATGNSRPSVFPARQTLQASETVFRQHGMPKCQTVFAQQNPDAIDIGIFHNDVVATGNQNLFFFHELAYTNKDKVIAEVSSKFEAVTGMVLKLVEVKESEVSLSDAVKTYLFNSQILTDAAGKVVLVAPLECKRNESVCSYLAKLIKNFRVFDRIHYIDLQESMQNGGGPACLRLRVPLTKGEIDSINGAVLLTDELFEELTVLVNKLYPDEIDPSNLTCPKLLTQCKTATSEIYRSMKLTMPKS